MSSLVIKALSGSRKNLIIYALKYFLAAVLITSGIFKILNPLPAIESVKAIGVFSEDIAVAAISFFPFVELFIAYSLIFYNNQKIVGLSVLLLFGAFFVFSIYGYIIGLDVDCGCFGSLIESRFGIGMIIRNLIFLLLAVVYLVLSNRRI